ncbi:PQQ-dependent sugar dehydrogenase [Cohnella panacarvi]|uniref:PQQ-dependent sugar dehydrogenase n=1 Tax=Cohnella panacarvi TaxID=400776 RepID=UPI00047C5254|nr:PQQ-dependent sugar dehydrogenase [Cohnella panacarvi]
MKKMPLWLVSALLLVGLTACFDSGDAKDEEVAPSVSAPAEISPSESSEASGSEAASPPEESDAPAADMKPGAITLEPVFGDATFDRPVGVITRKDHPRDIYIIEQTGRIFSLNLDAPSDEPKKILDLSGRVYDQGSEQGLLGLAWHPDDPGIAFVNYTTRTETVIARFEAVDGDAERLNPASEEILLTFKQPYANHNGGQLAFGPDGYLYIGTGDGGSGGDPHNHSQNLRSLLGKILRIDVDRPADGLAYGIPADNPFAEEGRPEIYAYGLRNPWRFSFDAETGKLWAADVGQNRYEEIDIVDKGGNYGWRIQEGASCYNPKEDCEMAELKQPIHTYGRDEGVSVTGGYVYRGSARRDLTGWYVFGDYGNGTIWGLKQRGDGSPEVVTLLASGENVTSFGVDSEGELYVCTYEGRILRVQ